MAVDMIVRYYLTQDNSLLGTEKYEGITEVLIPLPEDNSHPVTLTRFFAGQTCHRWKIDNVEQPSASEISMHLSARKECVDEVFLSKTYADTRTIASRIQKGTLVEVEYGYVQKTRRHTGITGSNKRYPDSVQHSEMHKRRLAVVVNSKFPIIQVIPVTSIAQDLGNNAIFELSDASLSDLPDYNDPDRRSYALAHMIQSVSIRRILPPLTWVGDGHRRRRLRSANYPNKLCREDLKILESAMTSAVGYGDYQSIRDERNQLRQEKLSLDVRLADLEEQVRMLSSQNEINEGLASRNHILMEMQITWMMGCYSISRPEAIERIEEEVSVLS